MQEQMTTSLIEAIGADSENIYCRNMRQVAEKIIDKYPENQNIELHQKFASICFYLKLANENYTLVEKINREMHFEDGYKQENLYRCLIQYISSMDSILDLLEKASIKLNLISVNRFERAKLPYNASLNTIRNFLMHEGLPFCRIERSKSKEHVFLCVDTAPVIENKVSFSLQLMFNSEKLTHDTFSLDHLSSFYPQFKRDIESYLAKVLLDKRMA